MSNSGSQELQGKPRQLATEKWKEEIEAIFERYDHQQDVVLDLYRLAIQNFDSIKKVQGHPEAGYALCEFICRRFMAFDRKHHPNVFAGGAWLNWGFTPNKALDPWAIDLSSCTFE